MSVVGALLIVASFSRRHPAEPDPCPPRRATDPHPGLSRRPRPRDPRDPQGRAGDDSLTDSLGPRLSALPGQPGRAHDGPATHTVRNLGRTDGYLSRPAAGSAAAVALRYVREHRSLLGLTGADLATLSLRRDYRDAIGVHHLSWTQRVGGVTVFGNGLRVNVDRQGRVISVQGSPASGLAALAAAAPGATTSAASARGQAARNVGGSVDAQATARSKAGETVWSNHDYARRVWFLTPRGLRPGWSTYVHAGAGLSYQHVIDAASGTVLFRRSTVNQADGDAYVYDYYPGAARGGDARTVNLIKRGWAGQEGLRPQRVPASSPGPTSTTTTVSRRPRRPPSQARLGVRSSSSSGSARTRPDSASATSARGTPTRSGPGTRTARPT